MIALLFAAVAIGAWFTVSRAGEKENICDYNHANEKEDS